MEEKDIDIINNQEKPKRSWIPNPKGRKGNSEFNKMMLGRELKISPQDFQKKALLFIKLSKRNKEIPFIESFAEYLGTTSKRLHEEYKDKPEYNYWLEILQDRIKLHIKKQMICGKGNTSGCISYMKNEYDWVDVQKTENTNLTDFFNLVKSFVDKIEKPELIKIENKPIEIQLDGKTN